MFIAEFEFATPVIAAESSAPERNENALSTSLKFTDVEFIWLKLMFEEVEMYTCPDLELRFQLFRRDAPYPKESEPVTFP